MNLSAAKYLVYSFSKSGFAKISLIWVLSVLSSGAFAQVYVQDALMFSTFTNSGTTAQTLSLGGAQAALGADISSASINPAGLGLYRKSGFVFSPSQHLANSKSVYLNNSASDNASKFGIGTLGFVISSQTEDFVPSLFRGGTFAVSFNRVQNFNSNISYSGISPSQQTPNSFKRHSIVDYYMGLANKNGSFPKDVLIPEAQLPFLDPDQALLEAAFLTYIIDSTQADGGGKRFQTFLPMNISDLKQSGRIQTSGSIRQWDIAYGANLGNKIYLGASLGILPLYYQEINDYSEQIEQVNIPTDDRDYRYYQSFIGVRISQQDIREVRGTGVNLKIGITIRPVDALRIGAYIHTPTSFTLTETINQSLTSEFNGLQYWKSGNSILKTYTEKPYAGIARVFKYNLITPLRFGGGLAYFVGKSGFITADAEYISYNQSKIKGKGADLSIDQKEINNLYKSVVSIKSGIEIRKDILRFRLGGGLATDPYAKPDGQPSRSVQTFSGGIGVRHKNIDADLGFSHSRTNAAYSPHPFAGFAQIQNRFSTISLTISTSFSRLLDDIE